MVAPRDKAWTEENIETKWKCAAIKKTQTEEKAETKWKYAANEKTRTKKHKKYIHYRTGKI